MPGRRRLTFLAVAVAGVVLIGQTDNTESPPRKAFLTRPARKDFPPGEFHGSILLPLAGNAATGKNKAMWKKRITSSLVCLLAATMALAAALQPPPESAAVTGLAIKLFEYAHYSHHKLDAESAQRFLRRYVEALDYNRLFFLQTDLKEFDNLLATLPDRTRAGDVQPGFDIYARYQQRVEQAVALAKDCLKQPMNFDDSETIQIDRSKAPWPADETERAKLWRERVKYDLLQESLNKTKPDEAVRVLTRRYDRTLRAMRDMDAGDVLEVYLDALCHSYDPTRTTSAHRN